MATNQSAKTVQKAPPGTILPFGYNVSVTPVRCAPNVSSKKGTL
jgi:hypothetical protein